MSEDAEHVDLDLVNIPNRYGRTPQELETARARIADARQRAEAGLIRDDSDWGRQKLEEERRLAAQ
jgi:succinate dehydrogenase/fumarate reductase flavoprotein subunit